METFLLLIFSNFSDFSNYVYDHHPHIQHPSHSALSLNNSDLLCPLTVTLQTSSAVTSCLEPPSSWHGQEPRERYILAPSPPRSSELNNGEARPRIRKRPEHEAHSHHTTRAFLGIARGGTADPDPVFEEGSRVPPEQGFSSAAGQVHAA